MKKNFFVVLVLVFSLVSCTMEHESEQKDDVLSYFDIENRYQAYLEDLAEDNEGFVRYERIGIVGKFMSYENYKQGDRISYTCIDAADQKVDLHIYYTKQEGLLPTEHEYPGMQEIDAACIDPNSHMKQLLPQYNGGFVNMGEVRYVYAGGKLQGIKWAYAEHEFMLSNLQSYPTDRTDTFTGRMLETTLAAEAVLDFRISFDAAMEGTR